MKLIEGIGLAVTGLVGYLGIRRVNSGSIKTSEAEDLWKESQLIRKELRDEVTKLRKELEECYEKCRKAFRRTG